MEDRSFQIKEELFLHFRSLEFPPDAQTKSLITSAKVKKPKMWLSFKSMVTAQLIVLKVLEY